MAKHPTFIAWLRGDMRPAWVTYKDASIYVRRSPRIVDGRKLWFIDLANFSRKSRNTNVEYNPKAKSTGFLRELFDYAEEAAQHYADGVFVESVLNEWLPGWLERRGYTRKADGYGKPQGDYMAPNYYLVLA